MTAPHPAPDATPDPDAEAPSDAGPDATAHDQNPSDDSPARTPSNGAGRLPAAERKQQLIDVALSSFAAAGFHGTSMNHIAAAAGVTKPVLYQHFSSKDHLFSEVVSFASTRLRIVVESALASATGPRDQVERSFAAMIGLLATDEATYRILFGHSTRSDPETAADVASTERSMAAVIADQLYGVTSDAAVRLMLAHAIVGMAEGALRHWYDDDYDLEPSELADHLAQLAWAGLRGTRP